MVCVCRDEGCAGEDSEVRGSSDQVFLGLKESFLFGCDGSSEEGEVGREGCFSARMIRDDGHVMLCGPAKLWN